MYRSAAIMFAGLIVGAVIGGQFVSQRMSQVVHENAALKESIHEYDQTTPQFVNHVIELRQRVAELEFEKQNRQTQLKLASSHKGARRGYVAEHSLKTFGN